MRRGAGCSSRDEDGHKQPSATRIAECSLQGAPPSMPLIIQRKNSNTKWLILRRLRLPSIPQLVDFLVHVRLHVALSCIVLSYMGRPNELPHFLRGNRKLPLRFFIFSGLYYFLDIFLHEIFSYFDAHASRSRAYGSGLSVRLVETTLFLWSLDGGTERQRADSAHFFSFSPTGLLCSRYGFAPVLRPKRLCCLHRTHRKTRPICLPPACMGIKIV